jgi:hypothetical protein
MEKIGVRYMNMDNNLTIEQIVTNDTNWVGINSLRITSEDMQLAPLALHEKPLLRRSESALPLVHEAASESFLVAEMEGRARLSGETRKREEARIAKRQRQRKRHEGACRGRRHWKRKEQTKEKALDRAYDKDAYMWFMKGYRFPADITRDEWEEKLQPVFSEYPRGSLRWSKHGGGRNMNVYTMVLYYHPLDARGKPKPRRLVYDGAAHVMWDVQQPERAERVMFLTTPKNKGLV